jgi:hypothetical protein
MIGPENPSVELFGGAAAQVHPGSGARADGHETRPFSVNPSCREDSRLDFLRNGSNVQKR